MCVVLNFMYCGGGAAGLEPSSISVTLFDEQILCVKRISHTCSIFVRGEKIAFQFLEER